MGRYINKLPNGDHLPAKGKAEKLLTIEGVEEIQEPIEFSENIVCVVDNGFMEAAGYAYSENELNVFKSPDGRPKRWFKVPDAATIAK